MEDHARALYMVVTKGNIGETYNIGGHNEKKNIDVVFTLCELLEDLAPENIYSKASGSSEGFKGLIKYVDDRPGHDIRYAIDASKIERDLGWIPQETFQTGLHKTIKWYLSNSVWASRVQDGSYQRERLGVNK